MDFRARSLRGRRNDEKKKGGRCPTRRVVAAPAACRRHEYVGDLALSRLLAINAADYPWLVLVPRRARASSSLPISAADAFPLTAEIGLVSLALKELTRCDKINIAAIGNVVPQLHVHIVARRKTDPLWPKPVFGVMPLPRAKEAAISSDLSRRSGRSLAPHRCVDRGRALLPAAFLYSRIAL